MMRHRSTSATKKAMAPEGKNLSFCFVSIHAGFTIAVTKVFWHKGPGNDIREPCRMTFVR